MAKASSATTLITREDPTELPPPTLSEIRRRHAWGRNWYAPRNVMIREFQNMVLLKDPWGQDRGGDEQGRYYTEDGKALSSRSPFPFDVTSLIESMTGGKHPYVEATAWPGQSDTQVKNFQTFMQAVMDTRLREHDLLMDMSRPLVTAGWMPLEYAYNPLLAKKNYLPFPIRVLDPLSVYPQFDDFGHIVWVTIEYRMNGAQLYSSYGEQPGIAELFEGEPDEADLPPGVNERRSKSGESMLTSDFAVIRYYDAKYTCLMVDCTDVGNVALSYNKPLSDANKASREGKHRGVFAGSDHGDEYQVRPHNLGCIPVNIEFCWAEGRGRPNYQQDQYTGRYMGLPFLYPLYDVWMDQNRLQTMLLEAIYNISKNQWWTDDESLRAQDLNSELVHVQPGTKLSPATPPQISPDIVRFLDILQTQVDRSSFPGAAYGARAGTSGIQQKATMDAGTIRFDVVQRKIQRGLESALMGIASTMKERSDFKEEYQVVMSNALGKEAVKYKMVLDRIPTMEVFLLSKQPFANPDDVAKAHSLTGILPTRRIYKEVLQAANPDQIWDELKAEKLETEQNVFAEDIKVKLLQKQVETAPEVAKLQLELEDEQDMADFNKRKHDIERELGQLPEEIDLQKEQIKLDVAQQKMQQYQQQAEQSAMQQPNITPGPGPMNPLMPTPPPGLEGLLPQVGMVRPGGPGTPLYRVPGMPPAPGGPPQGPPMGGSPMMPPPGMGQVATAPGQAQQPIQPLSRMQPPGGVGRPGVDSILQGPAGQPGQLSPALQAANRAVAPIPPVAEPTLSAATRRNKTRRGSRGRK